MSDDKEVKLALRTLRRYVGEIKHHEICRSFDGYPCDCYARQRVKASAAIDTLARAVLAARAKQRKGKR